MITTLGTIALVAGFIAVGVIAICETSRRDIEEWQDEETDVYGDWPGPPWSGDVSIGLGGSHGAGE